MLHLNFSTNLYADKLLKNGFLNNKYFIDIINFKINFNDDKTNITGSAIINDNILNYNYLKLNNQAARLEINFFLNDQFINNKYYTTNFIGNIPVKCVINSDIENMEYLCELNLSESQISIPEISFEKNMILGVTCVNIVTKRKTQWTST